MRPDRVGRLGQQGVRHGRQIARVDGLIGVEVCDGQFALSRCALEKDIHERVHVGRAEVAVAVGITQQGAGAEHRRPPCAGHVVIERKGDGRALAAPPDDRNLRPDAAGPQIHLRERPHRQTGLPAPRWAGRRGDPAQPGRSHSLDRHRSQTGQDGDPSQPKAEQAGRTT